MAGGTAAGTTTARPSAPGPLQEVTVAFHATSSERMTPVDTETVPRAGNSTDSVAKKAQIFGSTGTSSGTRASDSNCQACMASKISKQLAKNVSVVQLYQAHDSDLQVVFSDNYKLVIGLARVGK